MPPKLTPASLKKKVFARAVAEGKTLSKAYKEAFPKAGQRTAEVNGSDLLKNAEVQDEIAKRLAEITPENVLARIDEMSRTATPADNVKVRCLEMLGNTRKASIFKDSSPTITNNTLNVFDVEDLRRRLAESTGYQQLDIKDVSDASNT